MTLDCEDCSNDRVCANHPEFYCSGECGRWIHASCAGWLFSPDNARFLESTFGYPNPMQVPISAASQGDNPIYCIKCWEQRIRVTNEQSEVVPFDRLSREEQMLRNGVIPSGTSATTITRYALEIAVMSLCLLVICFAHDCCCYCCLSRNITNRLELLSKYAEDDILETIQ